MTPRILIIAGSDSGGGAGIQADIKTVTMLGGHAMTAVTAITAQNTRGVQAVLPVPTEIVVAQIESVVSDIGVDALKIGMLGSAETAEAVAAVLERLSPSSNALPEDRGPVTADPMLDPGLRRGGAQQRSARSVPIVFDPVMVATSGAVLADDATIAAFARLMRLATVTTPNLPEFAALTQKNAVRAEPVEAREQDAAPGKRSSTSSRRTVEGVMLVKGGHGDGDMLVDRLLIDGREVARWESPRIVTTSTHGTGCTLASAIAVGLARGAPLPDAIAAARRFVRASLERAPGLGQGHGPMGQQFVTGFDA